MRLRGRFFSRHAVRGLADAASNRLRTGKK
jgi:hypothetical protein